MGAADARPARIDCDRAFRAPDGNVRLRMRTCATRPLQGLPNTLPPGLIKHGGSQLAPVELRPCMNSISSSKVALSCTTLLRKTPQAYLDDAPRRAAEREVLRLARFVEGC